MSRTAAALHDKRTQFVLVLAGLRGAVSLALVENVPIYNSVTGEGCEFKKLMKAMTSACIIFTTFVFGGGAYYILPHLAISPDKPKKEGTPAVDIADINRTYSNRIRSPHTSPSGQTIIEIPNIVGGGQLT
jgi:NhaP-type Na+/H+ or K+/H+ antiporter